MATDQLKAAYEAAEKLSLKDQDMLAKKILEEIEAMEWDEKWDATFATPESDAYLDKLEENLEADIAAGKVVEYIPGKSLEELFR
ncbi:MAG TPA: hypothetical protein VEP90_12465 [Methylomirabilota bacterium]|nr:hypothetical protein [Methylomirabilota bacterium]